MAVDFAMVSGDTRVINVGITDENGANVDVSAATSVRYGIYGGRVERVLKTLGAGITVAGSVVTVTLSPADTAALVGFYNHELTLTVDGAVHTPLQGRLEIKPSYIGAEA